MKIRTIVLGIASCLLIGCSSGNKVDSVKPTSTPKPIVEPTVEPTEEPTQESTEEPTVEATEEPTQEPIVPQNNESSVFTDVNSLLLVANKSHPLPEGYEPSDLVVVQIPCTIGTAYMRAIASDALSQMAEGARNDGVSLAISSAYRGESYQSSLYYGYVNSYGVDEADRISSRPGYSDHQTGLACDFVEGGGDDFNSSFEYTASGQWLAQHAHEYGFIMRYPKGKAEITGYNYEPWHFRYIGIEDATNIYQAGEYVSFEEYFGVTGGDYQ